MPIPEQILMDSLTKLYSKIQKHREDVSLREKPPQPFEYFENLFTVCLSQMKFLGDPYVDSFNSIKAYLVQACASFESSNDYKTYVRELSVVEARLLTFADSVSGTLVSASEESEE